MFLHILWAIELVNFIYIYISKSLYQQLSKLKTKKKNMNKWSENGLSPFILMVIRTVNIKFATQFEEIYISIQLRRYVCKKQHNFLLLFIMSYMNLHHPFFIQIWWIVQPNSLPFTTVLCKPFPLFHCIIFFFGHYFD